MSLKKQPPLAKLYEAYSAIADERILMKETEAYVTSSDYSKTYTVRFNNNVYSSNDSATIWQHYPGYPILAVWMKQGLLPYAEELLPKFKGINWKALNKKYRNCYEDAIEAFLKDIDQQGENISQLQDILHQMLQVACSFDMNIKGNRAPIIRKDIES